MSDNTTPTSKLWNPEIISEGGISYWHIQDLDLIRNAGMKSKYRVALAKGGCDKRLKYKIKTAMGDVFSVAAKTDKEAQSVVNEVFGFGMYRVSQFII